MNTFNANLPSMGNERAWFAAVPHGRRIFVTGGRRRTGTVNTEMFDIDTQQWSTIPSMSSACDYCTAVKLGYSIIVMYHETAAQYNLILEQWLPFPCMNRRRRGFAAAVVDGKIIVAGGYVEGFYDDSFECLASVEEYDPSTGEWREITPMHFKRADCAAAVLDGKLYVVGGCDNLGYDDILGYDGTNSLSSAEVYDPTTQQWTLLNNMTTARSSCAAVSLEGRIVVAGGHVAGGYYGRYNLSSCEAYDPKTQKWSHITSMHSERQGCAAVEVEGDIYVLGGEDRGYNYC